MYIVLLSLSNSSLIVVSFTILIFTLVSFLTVFFLGISVDSSTDSVVETAVFVLTGCLLSNTLTSIALKSRDESNLTSSLLATLSLNGSN